MSHAPKSRPAKRGPNRKAASEALFNPAVFLETTASGRVISTHSKKDVIFAQGDDADAVFYIRKSKVKVAIVSKEGKEAVIALLGPLRLKLSQRAVIAVGKLGWELPLAEFRQPQSTSPPCLIEKPGISSEFIRGISAQSRGAT